MSIQPANWTSESIKNSVQTAGIILAAGWGFYTFVYQTKIAPAGLPPNVVVTPEIRVVASRGSVICLSARIGIKNAGHRRAYVIASGFTVLGLIIQSHKDTLTVAGEKQALSRGGRAFRELELSNPRVLVAGSVTPPGYWLDEGEEFIHEFLVYTPAGRYDAARLTVVMKDGTDFPSNVLQIWKAVGDSTEFWPNTAILQGRDTVLDPHNQEMQRVRKRYKFAYVQVSDETPLWVTRSEPPR